MQILLSKGFIIRICICPVSHQKTSIKHERRVPCTTPYKQTITLLRFATGKDAFTRCNNCHPIDRCACWRKWTAPDFPCNIRPTIRCHLFERVLREFPVLYLLCISYCVHTFFSDGWHNGGDFFYTGILWGNLLLILSLKAHKFLKWRSA